MLEHVIFNSAAEENEYWKNNPGIHLVKCIVIGEKVHVWVSEGRRANGMHMQPGGASND